MFASASQVDPIQTLNCATYQNDEQSLREYMEALRSVHQNDLTSPSVLDLLQVVGQLATVIYVRQRVAVFDGTRAVSCGEIGCCGGESTPEHMEHVDRALRELSSPA